MSTLAIMQPYLFPYIGYFQLVNAVDQFIVYDDVQYIKGGWINRNFILMNGQKTRFTFSLQADSTFAPINQRFFSALFEKERQKFYQTLQTAYGKAPCFESVFHLIRQILETDEHRVSTLVTQSVQAIAAFLGCNTHFSLSSEYKLSPQSEGTERILTLCNALQATHYINAIGGQALYNKTRFADAGIRLSFLQSHPVEYPQFQHPFVPDLSIIDVLMFNPPERVRELLRLYELV